MKLGSCPGLQEKAGPLGSLPRCVCPWETHANECVEGKGELVGVHFFQHVGSRDKTQVANPGGTTLVPLVPEPPEPRWAWEPEQHLQDGIITLLTGLCEKAYDQEQPGAWWVLHTYL